MVKIAFPSNVHYNWNGIDKHIFRVFIKTFTKKEMVAEWSTSETMDYDFFHQSLWKLFNAELVRRGAISDLKEGKKFYRRHYN